MYKQCVVVVVLYTHTINRAETLPWALCSAGTGIVRKTGVLKWVFVALNLGPQNAGHLEQCAPRLAIESNLF